MASPPSPLSPKERQSRIRPPNRICTRYDTLTPCHAAVQAWFQHVSSHLKNILVSGFNDRSINIDHANTRRQCRRRPPCSENRGPLDWRDTIYTSLLHGMIRGEHLWAFSGQYGTAKHVLFEDLVGSLFGVPMIANVV